MKLLTVLVLTLLCCSANTFAEKPQLAELNAFWTEVSRSVREGDFTAYEATCHPEGVLVSGSKKLSSPLSEALARWKNEFVATKAGEMKASVEFRFSQRFNDAVTAHETGIFLYSSTGPDGKKVDEYIHFEVLLLKKEGHWMTLMEYQKSKATKEEWDALADKP